MKASNFWDVIVVRHDGDWVGFRAPWSSLRRTASFFALLLIVSVFAVAGWLLTRWQVQRLSRLYASEQLKAAALEAQIQELKNSSHSGAPGSVDAALAAFSLVPSLDADELKSSAVDLNDVSADFDSVSKDWSLKFEIVRSPPREGSARYYWVALLHGPQGVLSFPPSLASRKGETVLFHRGQVVDDVRVRRAVNARFKLEGFLERTESEPLFVSLLVYDGKGSLLMRRRVELASRRPGATGRGE